MELWGGFIPGSSLGFKLGLQFGEGTPLVEIPFPSQQQTAFPVKRHTNWQLVDGKRNRTTRGGAQTVRPLLLLLEGFLEGLLLLTLCLRHLLPKHTLYTLLLLHPLFSQPFLLRRLLLVPLFTAVARRLHLHVLFLLLRRGLLHDGHSRLL